jgi:hypothetical protein
MAGMPLRFWVKSTQPETGVSVALSVPPKNFTKSCEEPPPTMSTRGPLAGRVAGGCGTGSLNCGLNPASSSGAAGAGAAAGAAAGAGAAGAGAQSAALGFADTAAAGAPVPLPSSAVMATIVGAEPVPKLSSSMRSISRSALSGLVNQRICRSFTIPSANFEPGTSTRVA